MCHENTECAEMMTKASVSKTPYYVGRQKGFRLITPGLFCYISVVHKIEFVTGLVCYCMPTSQDATAFPSLC